MRSLVVVAVSGALAGCLFPSFDGLKQDAAAEEAPRPATTADGAAPAIPGEVDASAPPPAVDAAPAAPKTMIRAAETTCEKDKQVVCVDETGDAKCADGPGGCDRVLTCNGTQDCPNGQVCCSDLGGATECRTSCLGIMQAIACRKDAPQCPAGTTCIRGNLDWAPGIKLDICL